MSTLRRTIKIRMASKRDVLLEIYCPDIGRAGTSIENLTDLIRIF